MMTFKHKHYFVTGTDTGIGKTYVTRQIMRALKSQGKSVLGLKPVACGTDSLQHEDAHIYLQENSLALPYEEINPYLLRAPVSPHIAADLDNKKLDVHDIVSQMQKSMNQPVDHIFIEGAGGVYVPLNHEQTMLDLMQAFNIPVILVVGLRLGCLNHAILSMKALQSVGLTVAGWVANPMDADMLYRQENIETLRRNFDSIIQIPVTPF